MLTNILEGDDHLTVASAYKNSQVMRYIGEDVSFGNATKGCYVKFLDLLLLLLSYPSTAKMCYCRTVSGIIEN